MLDGLKIGVECLEREELEKFVLKASSLGLLEVDIVDGKLIILSDLDKMVNDLNHFKITQSLDSIVDKEWELI